MSYNDLTPDQYTPEELAEDNHIEVLDDTTVDTILKLAVALEEVQELHGDDPAKWNAIESIIQAMNHLDSEAEITIKDDGEIQVSL
jgi:hypothetical protein